MHRRPAGGPPRGRLSAAVAKRVPGTQDRPVPQPDPGGALPLTLNDDLQAIRAMSKASLDPADWAGLAATIEQLRMLQIAEHSLGVGEALPDFALPDAAGRVVTSDELLDRGPLVLVFFRGGWCPYCDRTLKALELARPAVEATGAGLVGVAPVTPAELARIAAEKGLELPAAQRHGRGALAALRPALRHDAGPGRLLRRPPRRRRRRPERRASAGRSRSPPPMSWPATARSPTPSPTPTGPAAPSRPSWRRPRGGSPGTGRGDEDAARARLSSGRPRAGGRP